MKTTVTVGLIAAMLSITASVQAMGNRSNDAGPGSSVMSAGNSLGNNDGLQQAAGDIGAGIAKGGETLANQAWDRHLNAGATQANTQRAVDTASRVFGYGKAIEYAGKAAPHVGWVATSAGHASTGDYTGAAIQGVNGCARTVAVAKIGTVAGTAGGIWVAGKIGATAGSLAGPLGTLGGFVIGVGSAYVGGKIWDSTVGAGANAVDQKVADWQAQSQYGGNPQAGGGGGASWGGADGARDNMRTNTQQMRQVPTPMRPGGGDCGRH